MTMVMDIEVRGMRHCETTALGVLLRHEGLDLSEPMLFGLGSGLSFIYWDSKAMGFPFLGGRVKPFELTRNLAAVLGLQLLVGETTSPRKAWQNVAVPIDAGRPSARQLPPGLLQHQGALRRARRGHVRLRRTGRLPGGHRPAGRSRLDQPRRPGQGQSRAWPYDRQAPLLHHHSAQQPDVAAGPDHPRDQDLRRRLPEPAHCEPGHPPLRAATGAVVALGHQQLCEEPAVAHLVLQRPLGDVGETRCGSRAAAAGGRRCRWRRRRDAGLPVRARA